jgi:hypothetical protein
VLRLGIIVKLFTTCGPDDPQQPSFIVVWVQSALNIQHLHINLTISGGRNRIINERIS